MVFIAELYGWSILFTEFHLNIISELFYIHYMAESIKHVLLVWIQIFAALKLKQIQQQQLYPSTSFPKNAGLNGNAEDVDL